MIPPKLPPEEAARQAELDAAKILDTPPEAQFDRVTAAIAERLGVPIALVSLVDRDRQWFKSRVGLAATETSREVSFCGHVVADGQPLVVEDAQKDPRFVDNPLVVGDPNIRFYAGFPLTTTTGHVLGTLCAIDTSSHGLSEEDRQFTATMAELVSRTIELRIAAGERARLAFSNALHQLIESLQRSFIEAGAASQEWWRRALDGLIKVTGSEYGFIAEVESDEQGRYLRTHAVTDISWNEETQKLYASAQETGMVFRNLNTLFGRVLVEGQTVVANDVEHDPRAGGRPPGHPPLTRFLGLACGRGDQLSAVVGLANRVDGYSADLVADLEPAAIFIDACVVGVRNARRRRAAEANLSTIVEATADGIVTIDERGVILTVNGAVSTLFGYAPEECVGRNVSMLMGKPESEEHDGYIRRYLETGVKRLIGKRREVSARCKDGSSIWLDLSVSEIVLDGGQRGFMAVMHDVTARALEQQRLGASKAQLKAALEMAKAGYWELDIANDRFTFNDSFYKIFGTSVDQVGSYHLSGAEYATRFVHPEDRAIVGEEVRRALESTVLNYEREIEHRFIHSSGRVGYLFVRVFGTRQPGGPIEKLYGVIQDVTVHKSAEAARMRAEEQEQLNKKLAVRVEELNATRAVSALTSECVELVQRCVSIDEGIAVAARFLERMYSAANIAIYDYADATVSTDLVLRSNIHRFGESPVPEVLEPTDCWALRTRRPYHTVPGGLHAPCTHAHPGSASPGSESKPADGFNVCLPLMNIDRLVGLVSVTMPFASGSDEEARVARMVAQLETTIQSISGALATISLRESLQRLALSDELTGLPNRRAFVATGQKIVARARRSKEMVVVAMMDIDHFKQVNDTLGHEGGDRVLRQFAGAAQQFFRTDDLLGRVGGEEFGAVLLMKSAADAAPRLNAFREMVEATCRAGSKPVTVSVGFTVVQPDYRSGLEEALELADRALYAAKGGGRNRVVEQVVGESAEKERGA